ncbi:lycopene beta-cyclase CrtY [Pantoea sp. Aalb]|uniref:lycopene beta-cyclase CrtY n=1 Tax=Pantoea sp. Aalb TaxID=2576762 RepID=UPI001329F573|nr:lycopene beta-cyclase CrtY [Pantoea sp. Aalb]MXP67989.1 lycopene beta-cyclase CrtY [Pantoea sp. Aalb]
MYKEYDIILVGAGLANGLIALYINQYHPTLRCLMLESNNTPFGNHIWSFHQNDLSQKQFILLKPLISFSWSSYKVYFPNFQRRIIGNYYSITSTNFTRYLTNIMGKNLLTTTKVIHITPTKVILENNDEIHAKVVIDGRGIRSMPYFQVGYQVFIGQEWQLSHPHHLSQPILMDATVDQQEGYHFIYILPFNNKRLLIEDTYYVNQPILNQIKIRKNIIKYAQDHNWKLNKLIREEEGSLPIILSGDINMFWKQQGNQPCSGLRAGILHFTTGYSLPIAMSLAECIIGKLPTNSFVISQCIEMFARQHWHNQRFFRFLNRILFLTDHPKQRWKIIQHFYRLDADLISRFYFGHLRLKDKICILYGKPPVSINKVLRALLRINHSTGNIL